MSGFEEWCKDTYGFNSDQLCMLGGRHLREAYNAGVAAERERCAGIAEMHHVSTSDLSGSKWDEWGYKVDMVAAIRRGDDKNCKLCGKEFSRPKGISATVWENRVYCSRDCGFLDKRRKDTPRRSVIRRKNKYPYYRREEFI